VVGGIEPVPAGELHAGSTGVASSLDGAVPGGTVGGDASPGGVPSGADGTVPEPTTLAGMEPET
jgi:hypothetical protein